MRLIIPLILLFIGVKIVERLAGWLNVQIDYTWFWVGVGVAVVMGSVNFAITNWWSTVTRPARPQSVRHNTDETPNQIARASLWAIIEGIVILIIAGIIISQVLLLP